MASVFDVAEYVLRRCGALSAMKLQKLCYYAQAWSLVWDDEPLFAERIEAWANGPVCPALYARHRGIFKIEPGTLGGDATVLTEAQRETVDEVCDACGKLNAQQLSDMTHAEDPWRDARKGLSIGERGNVEITLAAMAEYYGGLPAE